MSDYGFSDIFSQNIAIFPYCIYFFRVFQHLMLKITPPPVYFLYNIYSLSLCIKSTTLWLPYKKSIAHFTLVTD